MFFIGCRPFFDLEGKSLLNKLKLQTGIFVLTAFLLGCNEFMIVGIISDLAQSFNVSLSSGYNPLKGDTWNNKSVISLRGFLHFKLFDNE